MSIKPLLTSAFASTSEIAFSNSVLSAVNLSDTSEILDSKEDFNEAIRLLNLVIKEYIGNN